MTDIVKTAQLQDPGSSVIVLYELEYAEGAFAYFYAGKAEYDGASLENVRFREWRSEYVIGAEIEYTAIPVEADGFEMKSDGAISRPTLSIANVGTALSDSIGGLSVLDLVGAKLTRRTTMEKYLVGNASDLGPGLAPVEYPRTVYYIDRIKSKNILRVEFELAAPYDLQGIKLPRRVIIGGACPFKYKGATEDLAESDRSGGCDWNARFLKDDYASRLFLNEFDEYIVAIGYGGGFTPWTATSSTNGLYTTVQDLDRYSTDGLTVTTVSSLNYWQALTSGSVPPSDTAKADWRRIRTWAPFSAGTTYYGYKNNKFSDYILKDGILWRIKLFSVDTSVLTEVKEGAYWTLGDSCGKKIKSCSLRYGAQEVSNSSIPAKLIASTQHLRFGGFPGVQQKR